MGSRDRGDAGRTALTGVKILPARDLIVSGSFLAENVRRVLKRFDPLTDMIDCGPRRRTITDTAPSDRCNREADYATA